MPFAAIGVGSWIRADVSPSCAATNGVARFTADPLTTSLVIFIPPVTSPICWARGTLAAKMFWSSRSTSWRSVESLLLVIVVVWRPLIVAVGTSSRALIV